MTVRLPGEDVEWVSVGVGEHWFGHGPVRLTTLLGSCVALCVWHPVRHSGGLAHIVLPERNRRDLPGSALDARYADEAIALLRAEAERFGSCLSDYHAKIFGGGDMLQGGRARSALMEIGKRNIDAVEGLLASEAVAVHSRHLGGHGHRKLVFDLVSGEVWLKFFGERAAPAGKPQDDNG